MLVRASLWLLMRAVNARRRGSRRYSKFPEVADFAAQTDAATAKLDFPVKPKASTTSSSLPKTLAMLGAPEGRR
jgi:hypothetical protein